MQIKLNGILKIQMVGKMFVNNFQKKNWYKQFKKSKNV